MKKQIDKHILEQTRGKLGSVDIVDAKNIFFSTERTKEDEIIDIQYITWTKKYYIFDRGDSFDIGVNFYDYEGTKLKQKFTSNESGGCYDGLIVQYTNALYAVRVYSDVDREFSLPVEVDDYTNLSIYKEEGQGGRAELVAIASSGNNYYVSGNVRITLKAETWTTLYIFAYFFKPNSFINILNGLLDNIDRWAVLDDVPPDVPVWYDPPLQTGLSKVSLTTTNILNWFTPEEADWAGHHIYSRRQLTVIDLFKDRVQDK